MEVEDNPGSSRPDDYARNNYLTIDSQIDPFSLALQITDSFAQPTSDVDPSGLTTDASLPTLHLPTTEPQEQLDVPKQCMETLSRAIKLENISIYDQCQMPVAQYEAHKRIAGLKFDLPALATNPEHDCRQLDKAIQKRRQPRVYRDNIPLERQDIARGEGLAFPDSARQLKQECDQSAYSEKLDVSKEAIIRLAHALKDNWSASDQRQFIQEAMPSRSFIRDTAITPPLSPFSESESEYIPDSDECEVPLASDASSMLGEDLKVAQSAVLQKESSIEFQSNLDTDTLQLSPRLDPQDMFVQPFKISSLRMESPQSPTSSPFHPIGEGVDIPALLESMDLDRKLTKPGDSKVDTLQPDCTDDSIEFTMESIMGESAGAVKRRVEQEQISICGAIARVDVPVLDFSIPDAEWQGFAMDTRVHLQWLCKTHDIKLSPCPRTSRADAKLRWLPFLKQIDLQHLIKEELSPEGDLSILSDFPNAKEIPTSADYAWKRPGLAILCETEDEELIWEPAPSSDVKSDIVSLARKRRLEMNTIKVGMDPSSGSDFPANPIAPSPPKGQANLLLCGESSSAISSMLSNYIDVRTAKRRKLAKSSYFKSTSTPEAESRMPPSSVQPQPQSNENQICLSKKAEKKIKAVAAPYPRVDIPTTPTKLIKSLNLSRDLFFGLEEHYPAAEIIERDFDRWNTAGVPLSSIRRKSPLADEADITVSPVTGIIVTTLLNVIQKPPPGYRGQTAIRERISCAALRYERLIVLISEANQVDETVRDLTSQETIAYGEFLSFTLGLEFKIEVTYVGGGEATLLKWLISCVIQHAPEAAESQGYIYQDETHWEVCLRRAGLNAYAAQAILGRLRPRSADGEIDRSKPALAVFITMTDEERLCAFRDLMGGDNVLNRVNMTLATKWR
ncbi:hypothetical protein F4808DRAFT_471838 [Astrocystis sublimbata]|nr:hypothetical protein F4808DRAFT_471838 [Astrocystis sublimbata]